MSDELKTKEIVETAFRLVPKISKFHNRNDELYKLFDKILRSYFSDYKAEILDIAPFDGMVWPHISMGNLTSYDFFALGEMLLYSFYWINRKKYKIAFDIGGNIGIDSIILSRFGYEVYSFEPDPMLYEIFMKNVRLNQCKNIHVYQKAISNATGTVNFVRVKGNLTASHIMGMRDFYGDAGYLEAETMTFQDIGIQPDLVKINVEGHEKIIVPSISYSVWERMDAFIEIHNQANSQAVYDYFLGSGINIFSQKLGWQRAEKIEDMPMSNKEGYIFVSKKKEMPWQDFSVS